MPDLTKVKTTDDGVDIYVDDEGRFLACSGKCSCDAKPFPLKHGYWCTAITVTRKSMADLLRVLKQADAPKVPIKAIDTDAYRGPSVVEVIATERDRDGQTRYRGISGDLMNHRSLHVYSDEDWQRLQEAHAAVVAAREGWEQAVRTLTRLDRDKFNELHNAAKQGQR